ncbi:hypothetical protein N9L68_07710 [bacterium]|nr:hypothetical protein [bacterium]
MRGVAERREHCVGKHRFIAQELGRRCSGWRLHLQLLADRAALLAEYQFVFGFQACQGSDEVQRRRGSGAPSRLHIIPRVERSMLLVRVGGGRGGWCGGVAFPARAGDGAAYLLGVSTF